MKKNIEIDIGARTMRRYLKEAGFLAFMKPQNQPYPKPISKYDLIAQVITKIEHWMIENGLSRWKKQRQSDLTQVGDVIFGKG